MIRIHIILFFVVVFTKLEAQHIYAPLNQDYYHLIDREELINKEFSSYLHSSFKPYRRTDIVRTLNEIGSQEDNKKYLLDDNWFYGDQTTPESRKPLLNWFYQSKPDLYHVNTEAFKLKVNPVLYLSIGKDENNASTPYINTRGIDVRGAIDDKIGFYGYVGENQAVFPNYIQNVIASRGFVPNEAFWKRFGDDGVDFFTARGYFTFQATKHIGLQFGYDKNFIGNGYRSLVLSDFSAPSTFLKIQTNVWRFQYTNLFTELIADAPFQAGFGSNGTEAFPKKFMAAHHLSLNITDNFNIGFFESIIFNRGDSTSTAFEWNYLNPVIFYRSVEQYTGSPDNALFGMDFKWNITKGIQLYGQAMLDEFSISELRANNGWWSNKFALQAGGKYVNAFGLENLDFQVEYNIARPFTYSHESIFTNYAHYRQPLAHPLGANFKELVFIGRYQPIKYLFVTAKIIAAQYGIDPVGQNLGSDLLKDYTTFTMEYGNEIGQGIDNDLVFIDLTASYMLRHNLFIDLRHIYRDQQSDDANLTSTTNFSSLAIRLNIAARDYSF